MVYEVMVPDEPYRARIMACHAACVNYKERHKRWPDLPEAEGHWQQEAHTLKGALNPVAVIRI